MTLAPIWKNVAGKRYSESRRSNPGVAGLGPSSKVSAMARRADFPRQTEGPKTPEDLPRTAHAAPAREHAVASAAVEPFPMVRSDVVRSDMPRSDDLFVNGIPAHGPLLQIAFYRHMAGHRNAVSQLEGARSLAAAADGSRKSCMCARGTVGVCPMIQRRRAGSRAAAHSESAGRAQ